MTKTVRIENADTNPTVEVVIEVWDKDTLINTKILGYPTQQIEELIWDGKKLIISERPKSDPK